MKVFSKRKYIEVEGTKAYQRTNGWVDFLDGKPESEWFLFHVDPQWCIDDEEANDSVDVEKPKTKLVFSKEKWVKDMSSNPMFPSSMFDSCLEGWVKKYDGKTREEINLMGGAGYALPDDWMGEVEIEPQTNRKTKLVFSKEKYLKDMNKVIDFAIPELLKSRFLSFLDKYEGKTEEECGVKLHPDWVIEVEC